MTSSPLAPRFAAALIAAVFAMPVALAREPAPAGAEVYIVSPVDGAKVKSPVSVVFGLKGMGVAPAGTCTWISVSLNASGSIPSALARLFTRLRAA